MLNQMDDSYRDLFPAILTHKYCLDSRIAGELRRTAGNSSSTFRNILIEKYTYCWMIEQQCYMTDNFLHKYVDMVIVCLAG